MTDRQQQILYFIATRHAAGMATTASDIIDRFSEWYPTDTSRNLGLFLTKIVRQKLIEVVDGRYQIYDAMAHSEDAEPADDGQLNLF